MIPVILHGAWLVAGDDVLGKSIAAKDVAEMFEAAQAATVHPLLVDLNVAAGFINAHRDRDAIATLNAFIILVRFDERLGITVQQGTSLIAAANQLIASL